MGDYSRLTDRVVHIDMRLENPWDKIIDQLTAIWLDDYRRVSPGGDILEVPDVGFWYVFDVKKGRLIAAFGFSKGKHTEPRDKARMAGHPLSTGPLYHRGHAIPHTLGGPTDINLVPQLGSVNIGAFRVLERKAVATPGSLYFTHWQYGRGKSQTPVSVEQGLLIPGQEPKIVSHANTPGSPSK